MRDAVICEPVRRRSRPAVTAGDSAAAVRIGPEPLVTLAATALIDRG